MHFQTGSKIEVVGADEGICDQIVRAAQERDKPPAGVQRWPIASRVGRDVSVEVAAGQGADAGHRVPDYDARGRAAGIIGVGHVGHGVAVRGHIQAARILRGGNQWHRGVGAHQIRQARDQVVTQNKAGPRIRRAGLECHILSVGAQRQIERRRVV